MLPIQHRSRTITFSLCAKFNNLGRFDITVTHCKSPDTRAVNIGAGDKIEDAICLRVGMLIKINTITRIKSGLRRGASQAILATTAITGRPFQFFIKKFNIKVTWGAVTPIGQNQLK